MKKFLLMMLCFAVSYMVSAETIVSGTIIDEEDQPLIGGSVIVVGTTQGTSTDIDGSFKLTVREGNKIQVSYLNYKTLTIDVETNQATQDLGVIKMKPEVIAMEDIVISQSVAVRIMNIELGNLKTGEYRKLSAQELKELYERAEAGKNAGAGGASE